ncbi:MAG TPA: hypothetical protein VGP62_27565 [Bryobacteraceae bacterium]|nr:hypothetical protein [Bryobacteraceae bacterium]
MLCEPGEESLSITADNFLLEIRNGCVSLQAWNDRRNLVRRVTGIESQTRGKLVLRIQRFGQRTGTLSLIDLRRSAGDKVTLESGRLEFREHFRRFLRRQFPTYKIAELTTGADLEHSLSPAYPRAFLRQGASAWAAIGASPDAFHCDGVLTFGLIWLDYLRLREPAAVIHGLLLYLPAELEKTTCLRLLFLNPDLAQYAAFVYTKEQLEERVDLRDYGNLDTRLEPYRRRLPAPLDRVLAPIREIAGVETIQRSDGELSLRVRGMEFARTCEDELRFGLERRRVAGPTHTVEIRRLAEELSRFRSAEAIDRQNPLYLRNPEAWLESQVRNDIEAIDARLLPTPIYGQMPAFAAADRGVLDLLAADHAGRLAVIELKASEDIHLPLQALDYWLRVKWHLDRQEFSSRGYFPGIELRSEPPRLLLVSPALDFHPSNERVLRYFSPAVEVERVGISLEWQRELKVVFRS